MRPHTDGRGRGRRRPRRGLAGDVPHRPRPPPRVRRRRVLPARRPAVPGGRRPTRASRCTRTASAWPAPSSSSSPATPRTSPACGPGSSPGPTPTPTTTCSTSPTAGIRTAPRPVVLRPRRARAGRRPHRHLRRPGARAAARRPRPRRRPGASPVENQFFGGNVGVAGLLVGEDLARVLADEPAGHRYLLPDVCLSQGRFLDGTVAGGPAPPGRGRRHRRRRPPRQRCAGAAAVAWSTVPCPSSPSSAVPTSASRRW